MILINEYALPFELQKISTLLYLFFNIALVGRKLPLGMALWTYQKNAPEHWTAKFLAMSAHLRESIFCSDTKFQKGFCEDIFCTLRRFNYISPNYGYVGGMLSIKDLLSSRVPQ